jgi:hypothetical protein
MPINVTCTQCGTTLRAPDTAAGKNIKCPKCAAILPVPAAPEPAAAAPPPPPPMATAAPAPPRRDDDYDRPSRRRDEDDDYEGRRFRRRDQNNEPSGTLPMVLGIISIVLAVIAIPLAFMGCCPPIAFIAAGIAGVALLLGAGGTIAAIFQKKGFVCPVIGVVVAIIAIIIVVVWAIIIAVWVTDTSKKLDEAGKAWQEEQRRRQEEIEKDRKRREEEANQIINSQEFQDAKKKSQENLKKIARALLDYEKKHGSLPYARFGGPGKEGDLSWRVAILPFLGHQELYDKFKLNEPWHSPTNSKLAKDMPDVFRSPNANEKDRTFYQVFTEDGMFGRANVTRTSKALRDRSQVFMVAESQHLVGWTEPNDIVFFRNSMPQLGGVLQGNHFNVALANGDVVFVSRAAYTDDQLRELIPWVNGKAPPGWPPAPK